MGQGVDNTASDARIVDITSMQGNYTVFMA